MNARFLRYRERVSPVLHASARRRTANQQQDEHGPFNRRRWVPSSDGVDLAASSPLSSLHFTVPSPLAPRRPAGAGSIKLKLDPMVRACVRLLSTRRHTNSTEDPRVRTGTATPHARLARVFCRRTLAAARCVDLLVDVAALDSPAAVAKLGVQVEAQDVRLDRGDESVHVPCAPRAQIDWRRAARGCGVGRGRRADEHMSAAGCARLRLRGALVYIRAWRGRRRTREGTTYSS